MTELLKTTVIGEPNGTPLLIAHGLFGSARNWGVLAKRLAAHRQVIAVDMRNHGESFHAPTNSYPDMAEDLARVIEPLGTVDLLGHSMGGKTAMVLALTQPELVNRLIVADIAPMKYAHTQAGKIAAMQAVDLSLVQHRRDADVQLQAAISDPALRSFLLQSLTLGDTPSWKLNLDVLASEMTKIMDFPDISGTFTAATLFLSGGNSDYVTANSYAAIRDKFSNATFELIDGAGHWLHAEKPREFEAAVNAFLS